MSRGSPNQPEPSLAQNSPISAWAGVALCLLLAVAQIALAGYQLGFGNQAIQIAFLKHWAYPWMYASDPMVVQTLPEYPSFFFRILAPLLRFTSVESLYLVLQIVTSFATLTCVYWLARSIFRTHTSAIVAVALLVGGHLQALAGDTLYSRGFTHTYAALPLAIAVLALAYRGRFVAACAVAGLLFNIHALTAAYALLMIGAAKLADLREQRPVEWFVRGLLAAATFFALASPTLAMMAGQHQTFDAEWISLTRIRSSDHSFASTWWASGDPDVPRFLMIFALFVLSLSFPPWRRGEEVGGLSGRGRWGGARRGTRITLLMAAAVVVFFAAGYIFTEWYPLPLMIRLQPFRASRLLLILMLVHIAHGAVAAIRGGLARRPERGSETLDDDDWNRPLYARIADVSAGVLVLATLMIPSFLPLLPLTLLVATICALAAGHLSWRQAIVCALVLQLVLLAALRIDFPLLAGTRELFSAGAATQGGIRTLAVAVLLIAGLAAVVLALTREAKQRGVVIAFTLAAGAYFAFSLYQRERFENPGTEQMQLEGAAGWARSQTSPNAVFLTALPHFRVAGERAIVGTWRDGTQVYFSANYGPDWLQRAKAVEPGLELNADGTALLSHGKPLETLDDRSLVELAEQYSAHYILVRTPTRPRLLTVAYADDNFTVYEPHLEVPPVPGGVFDPNLWVQSETFMNTTVQDNIAKYRMADLTLQVVDANGRPVQNLPIRLDQNRAAFGFGVSLGFFEPNGLSANGDLKPPTVRPIELEKLPEIFNASMIAFSSKWQYIEPTRGKYNWSDLDKYVDYGVKNNLDLEFHHLTGILPSWIESMGGVDGQTGLNFPAPIPRVQDEFNRHCFDTVARYADRIKYWQVVNEKYMMQYVPPVFKVLKEKYPNNQFGLSDCVKFFDNTGGTGRGMGRNNVQYKGADAVDWLISKGIQPDFFSVHGHYPMGLWADPQEMYNVFDYFAERKVKVHITEEYLQLGGQMYGPMRSGTWTPELQAEYLKRFMIVCFSHPNVDMANLWGLAPNGWGASDSGLIDANNKTRPAWDELKRLITQTWRSRVASELSLDGTTMQHVYHGNYTATITLSDGRRATATFEVPETPASTIRLRLDGHQGTLQLVK